jgi:hypothetical protein
MRILDDDCLHVSSYLIPALLSARTDTTGVSPGCQIDTGLDPYLYCGAFLPPHQRKNNLYIPIERLLRILSPPLSYSETPYIANIPLE